MDVYETIFIFFFPTNAASFKGVFFPVFINWTRLLASGKQQHLTPTGCVYKA